MELYNKMLRILNKTSNDGWKNYKYKLGKWSELKGGEKMNLRERPYLEVEVVEVKKEKREKIPKVCVNCPLQEGCRQYQTKYKKLEKKGTWVNGENIDKIKFPFACTFTDGIGEEHRGMVIKTLMDYDKCDTAYLLFDIYAQSKGLTSWVRKYKLDELISEYNIHIAKAKIVIFKEV